MSTKRNAVLRTATLLAVALAPAVPAVAQQSRAESTALTPRQIAAGAHAATLMVHAMNSQGDTLGIGTGFVISADGMFVTNYHVIEEAEKLVVSLLDGGRYEQVQLIAADPASDLALLKVPAQNLRPLKVGSDLQMEVGDKVFVMGNPLGMGGTFSDGMVSGRRPLEGVSMLQISAPISPGSSGGPVMNERGEVVGVATIMVMGGQNLNLAVPVRYLNPMMAQRAAPRPFSPAVLVSNPHAGLALVGDHPEPSVEGTSGAVRRRDPAREVQDQLTLISPMLQMRGYVRAFPIASGTGAEDAAGDSHTFTLEKGVSYLITGRCDAACSNVDVSLFDSAGHLLNSDTDNDDFPTVSFTPQATGSYRVSARIVTCHEEPCAYGVGVFRRDQTMGSKQASAHR